MLLALSVVLVFGVAGLFVGNLFLSDQGQLVLGAGQVIHPRIPWLLIGSLGAGSVLGIWSLMRARRWYKWVIVPVELLLAGVLTFNLTSAGFMPRQELALSVGDPFPSYSLTDQDGELHFVQASTDRPPALYIFYRGDW
jgi:hypothetical protein